MVDLPLEGRNPRGGIITAPIAGEIVEFGQGDPVVTGRRSFMVEDPEVSGSDTRQVSEQKSGGGLGWLVLLGLSLLI